MKASAVAVAMVIALGACATTEAPRMSGFTPAEATAIVTGPETIDACSVRTGRLIIEIERVVISEYPHHDPDSAHQQQPLVARYFGVPGHLETTSWVVSPRYGPGDTIDELRALRVFERPLRTLGGTHLIVRLAENDRTYRPAWADRTETAASATGALGVVGLPSPASAIQEGLELVRKLDRDDLILEWRADPDAIARGLPPAANEATIASPRPALRYRLASARKVGPANAPAATMDLVAYREAEPGCP